MGTEISVAGTDVIKYLGEHKNNLLPSSVTPRAVSGHKMQPIGKLVVTLMLGETIYKDDLHTYSEANGVLLPHLTGK